MLAAMPNLAGNATQQLFRCTYQLGPYSVPRKRTLVLSVRVISVVYHLLDPELPASPDQLVFAARAA